MISIGERAFDCSGLTKITIPDSVDAIAGYAFNCCYELVNITIPDSVTFIGQSAFEGCHKLTNITIPDSVKSIGKNAFENCPDLVIDCHSKRIADLLRESGFNDTIRVLP